MRSRNRNFADFLKKRAAFSFLPAEKRVRAFDDTARPAERVMKAKIVNIS